MDFLINMKKYKIAIIGSGISGLTSAYLLSKEGHEVHIYEKESNLGGHTFTVEKNKNINLDIGFMVFNKKTYPNFCKLIDKLNIKTWPSNMSFSFTNIENNFSYNGSGIKGLFCSKKNLFNPKFYKLLIDIIRFNKTVKTRHWEKDENISLRKFITKKKYSKFFINYYLAPLCSAIWSTESEKILDFPISFLFNFLINHALVDLINRPKWMTIKHGAVNYVKKIEKLLNSNNCYIHKNICVRKINFQKDEKTISIQFNDNRSQNISEIIDNNFDKIIFATHAPDSYEIIKRSKVNSMDSTCKILNKIKFQDNHVVLHSESKINSNKHIKSGFMPKNKKAWASWNYIFTNNSKTSLTYYLNKLQYIPETGTQENYFVSLNPLSKINQKNIILSTYLKHPVFNSDVIYAQKEIKNINGKNNIYFCGAYMGYGFHEDGVKSALDICNKIDKRCKI